MNDANAITVEQLEKNKVKITFYATPEQLEEGVDFAYKKNKGKVNIAGFRKGKVPRKMIELHYGPTFFYGDAVDHILPPLYKAAIKGEDLDVIARPNIDVVSISKEDGVTFTAEVDLRPSVRVGGYKAITYQKQLIEPTEEEILDVLKKEQEENVRLTPATDRPARLGDEVVIDYEGFVDDVPFENGKDEETTLIIGLNRFIPGFEDQLIGHTVGEQFDIFLKFPDEYHAENLKGKDARFHIALNAISERDMPALDDEFAQDISTFDTMEQLKASIADEIRERKTKEAKTKKEAEVLEKIIVASDFDDIEVLVDECCKDLVSDMLYDLHRNGMDPRAYLSAFGLTPEMLKERNVPKARKMTQSSLVLNQITKEENITITDEELAEQYALIAEGTEMTAEEVRTVIEGDEDRLKELKNNMLGLKTIKQLMDWAVETE